MTDHQTAYVRFKRLNRRIIAYRNRRLLLLIAKCLLLTGAIAALSLVSLLKYPALFPLGILAAVGLPLWCFKPWRFFKRRWIGVIESIDYRDSYENVDKSSFNPFYDGRHYVTYAYFKAIDEAGKKHTFVLDRKYESVYKPGDRVMNLPGIDYPIDLTVQDKKVCPKCGAIYPSENDRCVGIGCKMPTVELDELTPMTNK